MNPEVNNVSLQKVIELVEGNPQHFKEYVIESRLSEEQLRKLLKAEEAGKNRKNIVNFLKNELGEDERHSEKKEVEIGVLKAVNHRGEDPKLVLDIDGIQLDFRENPLLDFAGHDFEVAHPHKDETEHFENIRKAQDLFGDPERTNDTSQSKVEPVGTDRGQDEEKKKQEKQIEKNEEKEKLKELLKDEYNVDEDRIKDKDLKELKELRDKMRELEARREDIMNKFGLSNDEVKEKSLEELEELEDNLEKRRKKREELKDQFEVNESLSGLDLEELEEKEAQLRQRKREKSELADRLEEYGYKREELAEKKKDELEDLVEELEEKERILDEVGADLEKEELGDVTLDYLKQLKAQKEEREDLIEELEQHRVSREELESCTNEDLKSLLNEMDSTVENYREILDGTVKEVKAEVNEMDSPDYSRLLDLEKEGKNRVTLERFFEKKIEESAESFEEIEEEAENELEFLMGASNEDEEDEAKENEVADRIEEVKDRFTNSLEKVKRHEDNEEVNRQEKVLALLDKYRDLDDRTQAIKTAQVMKAYIERELGISKELTYGELSRRLKKYDDVPEIHQMRDFFTSIERQEYSGKIVSVDVKEVAKAAEDTVRVLSEDAAK